MRAASLIATIALTAACSRHDDHTVGADVKDAGHSVDAAAVKVVHDPDVRNAGNDFKQAGHDAAKDFRKLAAEARVEAHKLGADTRQAAHDVTRPDHSDQNS